MATTSGIPEARGEGEAFAGAEADLEERSALDSRVFCALLAKPQTAKSLSGGAVKVGMAVFDSASMSLKVAEFDADSNLSSVEAVLLQVGAATVVVPSGEGSAWQRRLPAVVEAVGGELEAVRRAHFSVDNLQGQLELLLRPGALQRAAAKELRLSLAAEALAALLSFLQLPSDESLHRCCRLELYAAEAFLQLDAAAVSALHVQPSQGFAQRALQVQILKAENKYGEEQAAAVDRRNAAAAAAAAAVSASPGCATSLFELFKEHLSTSLGSRRLHLMLAQPLVSREEIEKRHDVVEALTQAVFRRDVFGSHFKHVPDLDRIASAMLKLHAAANGDASTGGGAAAARRRSGLSLESLVKLYDCVVEANSLLGVLAEYEGPCAETVKGWLRHSLHSLVLGFKPFVSLVEHAVDLEAAQNRQFIISSKFGPSLEQQRQTQERLLKHLRKEREEAECDLNLPSESVKLVPDPSLGFVLRVVKRHTQAVLSRKDRFQVVRVNKNEVLFTSSKIRKLAGSYTEAVDEYDRLQEALVAKALQVAATYWPLVEKLSLFLGVLDVLGAFAAVAISAPTAYTRPKLLPQGSALRLTRSRHALLEARGGCVISNDCHLGAPGASGGGSLHLITGPNMGGKSTYIRQTALCVLLCQVGSFVPCDRMESPVFRRILARVGASDMQLRGVSSFLAEMTDAASILAAAREHSLVIVDELGRGTSTYEVRNGLAAAGAAFCAEKPTPPLAVACLCLTQGFGLAWAIARELATRDGCLCLFATHFLELAELEKELPHNVQNFFLDAETAQSEAHGGRKEMVFSYKVKRGHADRSHGVYVAAFAGLPQQIVARAQQKSEQLERIEKRHHGSQPSEALNAEDSARKRLKTALREAFAAADFEAFASEARRHEKTLAEGLALLDGVTGAEGVAAA